MSKNFNTSNIVGAVFGALFSNLGTTEKPNRSGDWAGCSKKERLEKQAKKLEKEASKLRKKAAKAEGKETPAVTEKRVHSGLADMFEGAVLMSILEQAAKNAKAKRAAAEAAASQATKPAATAEPVDVVAEPNPEPGANLGEAIKAAKDAAKNPKKGSAAAT